MVDDEELVLRSLRRALARTGWEIETAPDGPAGLAALERGPFQVVVSDFQMPGMDGLSFLRAVKQRCPEAERILLTGFADPGALEEAVRRGEVSRLVPKPWDGPQLQLTIASAFEQHEIHAENRRLLALTLQQNEALAATARLLEEKVDERTRLLARARDEWMFTFDAIERPIAVLERDLTVVRANKAYAAVAGRPVNQVPGKKCYQALFGGERPCGGCPLGRGETAGRVIDLIADDRSFNMSSFEQSERYVCIYRETTEEQMLTRRMVQTEKLAAVGQLAASVAHEINNPLGGILAFTQLMMRDAGRSDGDLETLRDIEHAALRCKRIVESLLKFSRRVPQGKVSFDANKAAEEAVILFKAQLVSRPKAKLVQELHPAGLPVEGDPNQIEQVVLNLLVNALQALKGGAGTVALKTRVAGEMAELRIEDDGAGITPEVRARLFEPAFTTKPPGEGTGFGLAISWSIAAGHGGTIEVESEPGRGSAFTLRIPLRSAPRD